jgi:23S rRNA pseudouridine1911/1915/1917 synthase
MNASHTVTEPAQLLAFLFAAHATAKKNSVRQWLKHRAVSVNGRPTTRFDHPLQPGDVVSIGSTVESRSRRRLPAGMTIRHEDDALIVIEKPEGMLSVTAENVHEKSAQTYLTGCLRGNNPRSRARVWVVHRLDRATSGLMVFAKSEAAMHAMKNDWASADKRYLAVVEGRPASEVGTFESHLDESRPVKVKSAPQSARTRHAVTHYRVVRASAERALVELTLETGRRNQIRVHLADAGCPVVGDKTYDAKTDPARRVALHAAHLAFSHPTTGQRLQFDSPLPGKLARLLN